MAQDGRAIWRGLARYGFATFSCSVNRAQDEVNRQQSLVNQKIGTQSHVNQMQTLTSVPRKCHWRIFPG